MKSITKYELKNHTEIVVQEALATYLRNNVLRCICDRCQADIIALALNRLPARYYVSKRGEIMTQYLPDQARVMVDVSVQHSKSAQIPLTH